MAEIEILTQIQLDSLLFAPPGQLIGRILLKQPIYDDSEASQIVQASVQTILIKFDLQSQVVYEAEIIRPSKDMSRSRKWVPVYLSPHCVKDRGLNKLAKESQASGQVPKMTVAVQFHVNRQQFLSMHHAVDNLSCMDALLPDRTQQGRSVMCFFHSHFALQ